MGIGWQAEVKSQSEIGGVILDGCGLVLDCIASQGRREGKAESSYLERWLGRRERVDGWVVASPTRRS